MPEQTESVLEVPADLPCKPGEITVRDGQMFQCIDRADIATTTPVQQEFAELLKFLRTEAESGVAAAKTQVPVVVHDIIVYQRGIKTFGVSVGLLIPVFVILAIKAAKRLDSSDESPADFIKLVFCSISAVFCAVTMMINIPLCFRAWFTPSLVILDYIKGLL